MRKPSWHVPRNDEVDINASLTPLIDVIFVILIVFIICAPILKVDNVTLVKSSKKNNANYVQDESVDKFEIHVLKNNSLLLNGKKTTLEELKKTLASKKNQNQHLTPKIFHDQYAFFKTYQQLKEVLESSGIKSMDLVLEPS